MARKRRTESVSDPVAVADGMTWKGNPLLERFLVPLAELTEAPDNANDHPERSIAEIAESYDEFGQQKAIVCDLDMVVHDGNGQLQAARRLGWTHIAATPSDLDGLALSRYALAVNKTAESSEWNFEKLANNLRAIHEAGGQIDNIGWQPFELEPLLAADWTPPPPKPMPEPGPPVAGGLVGPAPGMAVPIQVTTEQRETIGQAVDALREREGDDDITEGRAIELICADFLAGA